MSGEVNDELQSRKWAERKARGDEVETHLDERELVPRGWHGIEQNPMTRNTLLTRHYPDIGIQEFPGVLLQVADGRRSGPHPYVIKQTDSLDGARAARNDGYKVVVVWEMPEGTFRGNFVQDIHVIGPISDAARRNGSGTPAWRIDKFSLLSFDRLVEQLRLASPMGMTA